MKPLVFAAPVDVDPASIDLHRLSDAVKSLGVALEEGVSLRSDGTFTANAGDLSADLTSLDWSALIAPPPADQVADLNAALAIKSAELAAMKAALVDALTGTATQKTAALARIRAWKAA